jgi:hypothetical protein
VEHFRPLGQKILAEKHLALQTNKLQQIVVTNGTKEQCGLTLRIFSPYSYDEE